jgi:predicted RNA polymerase sigma factor
MDDRQQRQVNEAAEKFAEAIRESFQAVAERGASAQQLNAELTQTFFNSVIDNLRAQTEGNKALTRELVEQQERQQEATQAMSQESVEAYMDFMNSMFSYYQGTVAEAQRQAGHKR